jgi:hypothetical protein
VAVASGGVVCISRVPASTTGSLGSMAQRGLDVGRIVMYSHRLETFVWHHGGIDNRLGKG